MLELPQGKNYGNTDWIDLLRQHGGYYKCPRDSSGKRVGPLVGYAGKYKNDAGESLAYVGDEFANVAVLEANPGGEVLSNIAEYLGNCVMEGLEFKPFDGYIGMPMGGLILAGTMALLKNKEVIYPEKMVTAVKTSTSREVSKLEFQRHTPRPGAEVVVVEDVCNNFATTNDALGLIESFGAKVVGIACFLNRSPIHKGTYPYNGRSIPIFSLVEREIPEYKQNDPAVAADVAAGNVSWKPKNEWAKLQELQALHV